MSVLTESVENEQRFHAKQFYDCRLNFAFVNDVWCRCKGGVKRGLLCGECGCVSAC